MGNPVQNQKEVAPRNQLLGPVQMHARLVAPADKEFFYAHFVRNFFERLLGVANRKRHQDGARPRRNLVDIEPEPVGKEHDFRRNRGNRVVIVLPKEAEIDLGKCIDFGHAAHLENLLAGACQHGMIRGESSQLQPEVRFHRSADVGRPAGVDAPATVFILVIQDVASGLVKTGLVAGAEQRMEQDVIGFEGGIGFQFSAPVTLFVLLREEILARCIDSNCDPADQVVNLSKSHLRRRGRTLRRTILSRTIREGFFHLWAPNYICADTAGAAAIVSTISGGNPKRTFSGMISNSCTSPKPCPAKYCTTSCTRCSGADAPAVRATVFTSFNHCGWMSRQSSIRCAGVPKLRATSTNRFEFELLSEPTTSSNSAAEATCFTATCLFSVA